MTDLTLDDLDWTKMRSVAALATPVLPVAVQDADTGDVLMVAYATRQAVEESFQSHRAVFWSTSTDTIHRKGETSGDVLELAEVRVNCDHNSLLYRVRLGGGGSCHERQEDSTAYRSCFHHDLAPTR